MKINYMLFTILLFFVSPSHLSASQFFPKWALGGHSLSLNVGGGVGHSDINVSYTARIFALGGGFDVGSANGESYNSNYFITKLRLFTDIGFKQLFLFYEPGVMFQNGKDGDTQLDKAAFSNKIGIEYYDKAAEWFIGVSVRFVKGNRSAGFISLGYLF